LILPRFGSPGSTTGSRVLTTGVLDGPTVRVFLMGENRWLDFDSWPPEQVTYTPLYFHNGTGRSEASLNSGAATFEPPESTEQPDDYRYDPDGPVPSLVTSLALGPRDYRAVDGEMLTYISPPLEAELVIVGPVRAILYASSSTPDTDCVVRLCDVYPDGRSMSVFDGTGSLRELKFSVEIWRPWKSNELPLLLSRVAVPGRSYVFVRVGHPHVFPDHAVLDVALDVAPEHVVALRGLRRTLSSPETGRQALDRSDAHHVRAERRIELNDVGIAVRLGLNAGPPLTAADHARWRALLSLPCVPGGEGQAGRQGGYAGDQYGRLDERAPRDRTTVR
jgi:hypothetical protein